MRVQRAFAFIDVAGFSQLTARHGDEHAVELLGRFRTLVREACSRRGVRIAKWLGDGAMLVGVETTPLVATVLELQHVTTGGALPADLACGITCGSVILLEGDDYIGHAVNVAARLCDLAQPTQILALPELMPALPPWAVASDPEPVGLRGIDGSLAIVSLGLRPVRDGEPDPVCGIPLVPATAVATATDHRGRPVLLCSDSCLETYRSRPAPVPEEQGSLRVPLIGN